MSGAAVAIVDRAKSFRRPCSCGHYHVGAGKCAERACGCSSYRPDQSPEFLLKAGIRAGEWQMITVPQLDWLMRPGQELAIRVWACGIKHSIGSRSRNRGRLAVWTTATGKASPMTPKQFVDVLNGMEDSGIGRVTKQSLRAALMELEQSGAARRRGNKKGQVRLFFYMRPLRAKSATDEPVENGLDLVAESDYQIPVSDTIENRLRDTIVRLSGGVVKSFRSAVRSIFEVSPEKVANPDYQKIVEQEEARIQLVVEDAYQNVVLAVRSADAYKGNSSSSSACMHAEEPAAKPHPLERLQELFPDSPLSYEFLDTILAKLGPDPDPAAFFETVLARARRKAFGTGLLINLAADFARSAKARPAPPADPPPSRGTDIVIGEIVSPEDEALIELQNAIATLVRPESQFLKPTEMRKAVCWRTIDDADPALVQSILQQRGWKLPARKAVKS